MNYKNKIFCLETEWNQTLDDLKKKKDLAENEMPYYTKKFGFEAF